MLIRKAIFLFNFFIFLSPLRNLSVFISPLTLILFVKKLRVKDILIFFLWGIISILSFIELNGVIVLNYIVSSLLLFPFLFLLIFHRSFFSSLTSYRVDQFLCFFFHVLIINGIVGLIQFSINPADDSAIGFYGRSGLQMHGLAILYVFSFVYFYTSDSKYFKIKSFFSLVFFVTCFYGIGLVVFSLSLLLAIIISSKNKIRAIFYVMVLFCFMAFVIFHVNRSAFFYNINNIVVFFGAVVSVFDNSHYYDYYVPRKILVFINYVDMVRENPSLFVTGVGGGGFNSRAAFLLNGDYSSLSFLPTSVTNYHFKYVMPLWSKEILSQQYQDGSMNQPFSSFLSILAEYGFLGIAFIVFMLSRLRSYVLGLLDYSDDLNRFFINFIIIFVFIIGCSDNIYEYPEIIFPFFIVVFWLSKKRKSV
ncbi:hypothetical protein A8C75_00955 [Marinobacterium aestuarii]|uniref:O-antigen polymerase n=2 Tax=Marinobacterium aestuarii TaxID=1821621 RepID=A0A1A9EUE5_9GAMM|nr:hypothetical protein A8C75_00955 [Marinobacterium aestuarii]